MGRGAAWSLTAAGSAGVVEAVRAPERLDPARRAGLATDEPNRSSRSDRAGRAGPRLQASRPTARSPRLLGVRGLWYDPSRACASTLRRFSFPSPSPRRDRPGGRACVRPLSGPGPRLRRIVAFGAAVVVGFMTVAVRGTGMLKELLVAWRFGRSDDLEAFLLAFVAPSLAVAVIGGSFGPALIPTFVRVRDTRGSAAARALYVRRAMWSVGCSSSPPSWCSPRPSSCPAWPAALAPRRSCSPRACVRHGAPRPVQRRLCGRGRDPERERAISLCPPSRRCSPWSARRRRSR